MERRKRLLPAVAVCFLPLHVGEELLLALRTVPGTAWVMVWQFLSGRSVRSAIMYRSKACPPSGRDSLSAPATRPDWHALPSVSSFRSGGYQAATRSNKALAAYRERVPMVWWLPYYRQ